MEETSAHRAEFLGAVNTEYFVLQGIAAASVTEASSRASLYLLTLSSGLVALGFVIGLAPDVFAMFASAALTTVFVLGWFTVFRLVDTSVANFRALTAMAKIRTFFVTLHPLAPTLFATTDSEHLDATTMLAIRRPRQLPYSTMASMIGAVNAVVGGVGAAMLADLFAPRWAALGIGIVAAAGLFVAVMALQRKRFQREFTGIAGQ